MFYNPPAPTDPRRNLTNHRATGPATLGSVAAALQYIWWNFLILDTMQFDGILHEREALILINRPGVAEAVLQTPS